MKKSAILFAALLLSGSAARAAELEKLASSSDLLLSDIAGQISEVVKGGPGGPGGHGGFGPGGHDNHGGFGPGGHNDHGNNGGGNHGGPFSPGGHGGPFVPPPPPPFHPDPYHPHPYHPIDPTPYIPGPVAHNPNGPFLNQIVRFESGNFNWASDAQRSMEDAAMALARAGFFVSEKHLDGNSYRLSFEAVRSVYIERYDSQRYNWASEVVAGADNLVNEYQNRGWVVLEKNIGNSSFSVKYFR